MAEDAEDRTEAASPRRLQQAREEGKVPVSRELSSLAGLSAALLGLTMLAPMMGRDLAARLQPFLAGHYTGAAGTALRDAALATALAAGPLIGLVLLGGLAAGLGQTQFLFNTSALMPDLSRLDPRRGLKRLFGKDNAVEAAKALVKLLALGWAAWRALSGAWPLLWAAPGWTAGTLLSHLTREVLHLVLLLVGAQAVIALADAGWVRFRFARQMRMSKEEHKQEAKETEGDPKIKGRLRKLRMMRARKRMMAAVPKATVVITNPTHYAIALSYERGGNAAPKVVAKGVDEVAARIRAVAQENGVPLVANPPLARALYKVELDAEIPHEHFQTVAEIIAYVWRLRGKAGPVAA